MIGTEHGGRWWRLGIGAVALAAIAVVGLPSADAQTTVDSFERGHATANFVDSFEGGDLDAYSAIRADDADGSFQTLDNATLAREGTSVLGGQTGSNGDPTYLVSTDGLDHYPEPGDSFGCWIRTSDDPSTTQGNLCLFGVESRTEITGYGVGFNERQDQIKIQRYDAAKDRPILAWAPFHVPANAWFNVEVDWGPLGTITATFEDVYGTPLGALIAVDHTYAGSAIGFNVNAIEGSNNTVHFDYYRISSR